MLEGIGELLPDLEGWTISAGDMLNAYIALGLGGIGIWIATIGLRLTKRQESFNRLQEDLLLRSLSQKSWLNLGTRLIEDSGVQAYELSVSNLGSKTVNWVQLTLYAKFPGAQGVELLEGSLQGQRVFEHTVGGEEDGVANWR